MKLTHKFIINIDAFYEFDNSQIAATKIHYVINKEVILWTNTYFPGRLQMRCMTCC